MARTPAQNHPRADARSVALAVLRRVETEQAFASSALRAAFHALPDLIPADRGLATELVYGTLRRRAQLDARIETSAGRRMKDIDLALQDILRLATYQLLFLDRVPDYAAVNAAVEQTKARRMGKAAGFVNAVLRSITRVDPAERVPTPPAPEEDPIGAIALGGGLPRWIAARLIEDLGEARARAFAEASLKEAPLSLRVNRLKATPAAVLQELGATQGSLPYSLTLPSTRRLPAELPAVKEGRATPQDEASMRVVELLDPQPGERILDLCAAPGGKTTCAAEAMGDRGEVIAYDRLPNRLRRVRRTAARLGLSCIQTVEVPPEPGAGFDRVLVDAPCSGLGTLRRHPEIRWRLLPEDIEALSRTQAQLLSEAALLLRPGGVLVYSVCTVTRAEGEAHLEALPDNLQLESTLQLGPEQPGAPDGFFAARLHAR